jgi:hypothetical protein
MAHHDGGSVERDGAESADRRPLFEIQRAEPSEIWGSHVAVRPRSQGVGLGGDKGGEIPRSRDHGATVPSTPVRFLLLPQHPYPGGLGNNKLRLRDGGGNGGGNATSEKGTRRELVTSCVRSKTSVYYMIREMATLI